MLFTHKTHNIIYFFGLWPSNIVNVLGKLQQKWNILSLGHSRQVMEKFIFILT